MPAWSTLKKLAHTLPYDAVIIEAEQKGRPLSPTRWDAITAPTLVIGGKSPEWMRNGVRALAAVLPNAHRQELPGQTHLVKPKALAPVLLRFFTTDNNQTRGMTVGELDQKG